MFLAVDRHLNAVSIETRSPGTGIMGTAPVVNVHHAVLSMLPAVRRRLAALDIECRYTRAECI